MKFNKRGDRIIKQQEFDKEKIEITIGGHTYNMYDKIQAANIDTDIVEVMKKYHMTEDQAMTLMEQNGGIKGVFENILELQKEATTLQDLMKIGEKAQRMFEELPAEVKEKYGNNLEKFLEENQKPEPKEEDTKQKEDLENETK